MNSVQLMPVPALNGAGPAAAGWLSAGLAVTLIVLGAASLIVGRADLIAFSPRRLWALAVLTFRESIRRRVLLLAPAAMLLILAIGHFQRSVDPIDDIRQSVELCLRAASALTFLLVILLAVFAFPRELESRTIFTLLAKPVTRLEVLLGKFVGLSLVAGAVLTLMGAFSYGYLAIRASRLAAAGRADWAAQQRDFELSAPALAETAQAATVPASRTVARRYEPPDSALKALADMGLLVAMDFVEPAGRVRVVPEPPPGDYHPDWQWLITGRGYMACYVLALPPPGQRGRAWQLRLEAARAGITGDERLRMRLQFYAATPPTGERGQRAPVPAALASGGWRTAVGEPVNLDLHRAGPDLWRGGLTLVGEWFEGLGPMDQLAVGLFPLAVELEPRGEWVGLRPDSLTVTVGEGQNPVVRQFRVFPRVRQATKFSLHGPRPGGPIEQAVYEFKDLDASTGAGDLVFQMQFEFEKGTPQQVVSYAQVTVVNPKTGAEPLVLKTYPGGKHGSYVTVPRDFAAGGELTLHIRPVHDEDILAFRPDSVRLLGARVPFAWNLAKSLAVCALQTVLVVGIGVTASVFLSWPVALLLTSLMVVAGNVLDFIRSVLARDFQVFTVEEGMARSVRWMSEAGNQIMTQSLWLTSKLVPDLAQFDPVRHIGVGLNIPATDILGNLIGALLYLLPVLLLGYLALHFKEVAR